MTRRGSAVLLLFVSILVSACRQTDGTPPTPSGETSQRLVDLGRDLEHVAAGDAQAPQEFTDDLLVYVHEPTGTEPARKMAATITRVLKTRTLNAETSNRLAMLLWTSVAARDFSERQIDALSDDVRGLLIAIGVSQQDANAAAGSVGTVQRALTRRARRWYERY